MSAHELTPEESARVAEIKTALEQELREPRTIHTSTIKDIEDLKVDALGALKQVLKFSQNETLKSKVAMWTYERLLEQGKAGEEPAVEFFKGMSEAAQRASNNSAD